MSYDNPTPLRVGATGSLEGRRYRVAGRVVLGMDADDGERYFWNEFNLVDGFGRSATLVFEETEDGPSWKLFKYFEPAQPLTASEAALKKVGDMVSLDGVPTRVSLVDQTRVYHIEGTAPDGVEVEDVAHYFNAERTDRMLVASWTGDDIEFFEGKTLLGADVASAFGLSSQGAAFAGRRRTLGRVGGTFGVRPAKRPLFTIIAALVGIGFCIFGFGFCQRTPTSRRATSLQPPPKMTAVTQRLATGTRVSFGATAYQITSHAVVTIARVGRRVDSHQYHLVGDGNETALLINGLNGGAKDWHLFKPARDSAGPNGLTPYDAAALKKGAAVNVPGRSFHVMELFQAALLKSDGPAAPVPWPEIQYGFMAQDGTEWLIARWTETEIQFHRGRSLPDTEVLGAMGPEAANPPAKK